MRPHAPTLRLVTERESITDPPFQEFEPTVDIAIPTLGDSAYLVETVESVIGQTHTSWRLVISENAAGNDRMRTALEPYLRDPRVRHVVRGETTPRGEHYTRLIRTGSAPYVAVLHDDDRWGPEFLARTVRFLDDHPTCGFVFSGYRVIDEGGRVTGRSRNELAVGAHPSSWILPVLFRSNPIAVPTVLVRRSAYEAVGSEYLEILFNDHEMWLRLAAHADVGVLDGWDADYRVHAAQTSSLGRLELAARHFEVLDAVEDFPIPEKLRRRARSKTHMRCALDLVELGRRRDALSHLARAVRVDPSCVIRPESGGRALAALGALASGDAGRRALSRRRHELYRSRRAEFVAPREAELGGHAAPESGDVASGQATSPASVASGRPSSP